METAGFLALPAAYTAFKQNRESGESPITALPEFNP
jgi:hypothetical protein